MMIACAPPSGHAAAADPVAERGELGGDRRRHSRSRAAGRRSVGEAARRVDRLLRVHAEVDQVRQHPDVAGRLVVALHHPERHQQPPVAAEHRRDDGVQRPLAAAGLVGMARRQVEAGAAVLEVDPEPRRGQPRAEAVVGRIDHRHRHPVAVDDAEKDGVAVDRLAGRRRARRSPGRGRSAPPAARRWRRPACARAGAARRRDRRRSGRARRRRASPPRPRGAPARRRAGRGRRGRSGARIFAIRIAVAPWPFGGSSTSSWPR